MVPNVFGAVTLLVMVTVSVVALVVSVIPVPAANVSVSVLLSATTLLCPATAIVWNVFPFADAHDSVPLPLVDSSCPLVPSADGSVYVVSAASVAGA
jgi:hypothetical protein